MGRRGWGGINELYPACYRHFRSGTLAAPCAWLNFNDCTAQTRARACTPTAREKDRRRRRSPINHLRRRATFDLILNFVYSSKCCTEGVGRERGGRSISRPDWVAAQAPSLLRRFVSFIFYFLGIFLAAEILPLVRPPAKEPALSSVNI